MIPFKEIEAQLGHLMALPPAPVLAGPDANVVECACRKKNIHVSELVHHWTGICNASDNLCTECSRMMPNHALIACLGCQAVVARIAPERLKSGFTIEPRKIYHTDQCPNCHPEVTTSKILEAEVFYRSLGHSV